MKAFPVILISAAGLFLGLTGCETAHDAASDTKYVAKKGVHAAGHAVDKAGRVIEHGGRKIEEHTAQ